LASYRKLPADSGSIGRMPCEIVLVRHAQSVPPTPGGPDELARPLTPAGLAAADRLVAELSALAPTTVVSSPYLRAVQTVAPTARALGLDVETRWELREWESGLTPSPDYAAHYARSWADVDLARPGGESLRQLTDRAVAAIGVLASQHPGGRVVVGTHGTFVARLLAGLGRDVDFAFWRHLPMPWVHRVWV
jgi:2,3-bisphosphoglycerate-dependent phosphoglycerate mutase